MRALLPERCGRVLEIGCGAGVFSSTLPGATERWGVEPDPVAAGEASKHLDHVLTGLYDQVSEKLPDGQFDVIICNDVIEHVVDHDAFLDSIRSKLSASGVLIASVPNVRYYKLLSELVFGADWRYREQGTLDRTHLRWFTRKSLLRTLGAHGFAVDKIQGINGAFPSLASWFVPGKAIPLGLILLLTLGAARDILYVQYGVVARKG